MTCHLLPELCISKLDVLDILFRKASNAKETQVKRKREAHGSGKKDTPEIATGKMMVLDFCSSDEE